MSDNTINVYDLSLRMQAKGFEYASFTERTSLDNLETSDSKFCTGVPKPTGGIWFSKISESYNEDAPDDYCVAPEWHNFVMCENFKTDLYGSKSIVFAKFDHTNLVSEADSRFKPGGSFLSGSFPDWKLVAAEFAGISVNPSNWELRRAFPGWDVNTVCVWNKAVLTEMHWFENAGGPWTYTLTGAAQDPPHCP